MSVFIDDKPVEVGSIAEGTIEEVVRHVQSDVCPRGRLIVALRCNGEEVTGDTMSAKLGEPFGTIDRLDIVTGTREALVQDTMDHASSSLDETAASCQRIAGLISEGKATEGMESLGHCLRTWQQIYDALNKSIEMLGVDPEVVTVQDMPLIDAVGKPKEILLQIKQALQAQDYVMLADILQYEFIDTTELWHTIIARIRQLAEDLTNESDNEVC